MSRRQFYPGEEFNYPRIAPDYASQTTTPADCSRHDYSDLSTKGAVAGIWTEWRASSKGVLKEEIESEAKTVGDIGDSTCRVVEELDASSFGSTSKASTVQSVLVVKGPRIDPDNKGFQLLTSMGWREGQGLGKSKQGMVEPILAPPKTNRAGLGSSTKKGEGDQSKKRRWEESERRELVEWLQRLPSHPPHANEHELAHQLRRDLPIIGNSRHISAIANIIRQLSRYPQSKREEWIVHRNGGFVDTDRQGEACDVWTDEQRSAVEQWLLADASRQRNGDLRWLARRAKKALASQLRGKREGDIRSMITQIQSEP